MHIAIVGATGVVGRELLSILQDFLIHYDTLSLVASERSAGKKMQHNGQEYTLITAEECVSRQPDIAIFSAGATVSEEWAPKFAQIGCRVIDNSSAWRMDDTKKLIVPEINGHSLTAEDMIIANPNCSTIQLVVALKPLSDRYGLKRVVVSTYQAVSGTGSAALVQMEKERSGDDMTGEDTSYPYPIDNNCIPHCDIFFDNGYTKEEMKLVNESRKILDIPNLRLTATAVRVPVTRGHSESVNIEFESSYEIQEVKSLLTDAAGIKILDDPKELVYPMPLFASGQNEVFVGRLRRDPTVDNGLNMWVVSDNLRKGAATNALQIAEIVSQKFIHTSEVIHALV